MESVGFTRQQAEKMAEEQAKLIDERLATKEDADLINANIATTVERLNASIATTAERLNAAIATTAERLNASIAATNANIATTAAQTKAEILKWMFGTVAAQTVVLLAAMIGILRAGVH